MAFGKDADTLVKADQINFGEEVDKDDVDKTMEALSKAGETCYVIGEVVAGEKGVDLV